MVSKVKFDWRINAKKGFKMALVVLFAGLASVYGNNPIYLGLVPLFTMIENRLKHL